MGIPTGFRYLKNMALYLHNGIKQSYLKDYGKNLECKYDKAEKTLYKDRIFCLDCEDFGFCKGRFWRGCPNRSVALKIMRREV